MDNTIATNKQLDKIPPQNLEAEQAVLGSLLIDKDAIIKIMDIITAEDFYKDKNKMIFEAITDLYSRHEPIDAVSLTNRLSERQQLEAVGGRSYLVSLANMVPTASNIENYAHIVQRKATLRRLLSAASEMINLGYQEIEDVDAVLDQAEQKLFSVSQKYLKHNFIPISSVLNEAFDRIDEIHRDGNKMRGLKTSFSDLDNILSGLQKSDLIILAARPSMGKTSLALDIARQTAMNGAIVGLFSLEMSKEQLVDRLLCAQADVDLWKMRTGKLSDRDTDESGMNDFQRIGDAMGKLSEVAIYIDDGGSNNIMEIRTKARRLKMEHGLDLLIIDYIQLLTGSIKTENRVQEVSEISRAMKQLARELNIPVLALSQLSRAVESRNVQIPKLSDLRESGCLLGSTMIVDAETGQRYSIENLAKRKVKKPISVFAMNSHFRMVKTPMTKIFSSGKKEVFRLLTRSGRVICASANHPFYKIQGWTRLDTLKNGDRVAIPRELAPEPSTDDLKNLIGSDIYWDEIVSITPMGRHEVYDATVPTYHNFVANDIVVHNSLEQDSDVVVFIYREDYHKKDTDRPNIADIIIAKHRNGPVGQIELFFDQTKASFRNLAKAEHGFEPPPL